MSTVTKPKKMGLGRGFDSLIPQNVDKSLFVDDNEKVRKLDVAELSPNPAQPRQHFDQEALDELAVSIKQYGIIQPLVVSPGNKAGEYTIIAGERRWRAAQLAGLKKVPAVVRTSKELERLEIAIVENVQRVDLSPLEQAASIERLHQQFNLSYEDIGKRLGKANSTVHNIARLLQLPQAAIKALQEKKITEGHARSILALKGLPEKQAELLANIVKKHWSVRQAEQFVTSVKEGFKETQATQARMRTQTPATEMLSEKIGTPVHIRRMAKGGKLEITFTSDEQLEKIFSALG